jgi:hypothetical protein
VKGKTFPAGELEEDWLDKIGRTPIKFPYSLKPILSNHFLYRAWYKLKMQQTGLLMHCDKSPSKLIKKLRGNGQGSGGGSPSHADAVRPGLSSKKSKKFHADLLKRGAKILHKECTSFAWGEGGEGIFDSDVAEGTLRRAQDSCGFGVESEAICCAVVQRILQAAELDVRVKYVIVS